MTLLSSMQLTIEFIVSSKSITSEHSFIVSVPVIPMEIPTSDIMIAGASLVPSAVQATLYPKFYKA